MDPLANQSYEFWISRFFEARDTAHKIHLTTRSFSAHTALGELYELLQKYADKIAEALQGSPLVGLLNVEKFDQTRTFDKTQQEYLFQLHLMIDDFRRKLIADGVNAGIPNLLDELLGEISIIEYKLKAFVSESISSRVDYEVEEATAEEFLTKMKDKAGTSIVFNAEKLRHRSDNVWNIAFGNDDPYAAKAFSLTGNRDEFKIFSFVKASMIELIERYHPDSIIFSASNKDSPSRSQLYSKMLKKFLPAGYSIDVAHLSDEEKEFKITKNRD